MWRRSFFLQAAWSYQFKQNLGFADFYAAMDPGKPACPGFLEPFNTNPVTSCFVAPYLRSQEASLASPDDFLRARASLASSFAATGDRLTWFLLRPMAGLLAAATVVWFGVYPATWNVPVSAGRFFLPAAVLLLAYNGPQIRLRASLWQRGRRGASPAGEVQRISRWAEVVRRIGLVLTGSLLVWIGTGRGESGFMNDWRGGPLPALALSLGLCLLVLRWKPRAATLVACVLLLLRLGSAPHPRIGRGGPARPASSLAGVRSAARLTLNHGTP